MHKKLGELPLKAKIVDSEFDHIPAEGSFIAIVNRFSEQYEELALIELLKEIRPDIKIISLNSNTKNNENAIYIKNKSKLWRKIKEDIIVEIRNANKNDIPIVVFPSRRISMIDFEKFGWDKDIVKSIFLSKLPIIPIYCNWGSKLQKYPLGFGIALNYFDNTFKNQLNVGIGKPIHINKLPAIDSVEKFRKFIYAKTYSIGNSLEIEPLFFYKSKKKKEEILPEIDLELLRDDIKKLQKDALIVQQGSLKVYSASALQLPNILAQIGILREKTFREVGEGTGKGIDIDEFDVFYYHLFIWDDKKNKIVGACRIAFGDWVLQYYGKKGLYSNTLFQFDAKMNEYLSKSVELGRTFIIKEYQKQHAPLLLIWKAIFEILKRNENYQYIIGPVSISDEYSDYSKKFILHYLTKNHLDNNISKYVTPKNPYLFKLTKAEKEVFLDEKSESDIHSFNSLLEELQPKHLKLPVLIRQYIKQNAKFLGFNIDSKFSDVIDGLMILDIKKIPNEAEQILTK